MVEFQRIVIVGEEGVDDLLNAGGKLIHLDLDIADRQDEHLAFRHQNVEQLGFVAEHLAEAERVLGFEGNE